MKTITTLLFGFASWLLPIVPLLILMICAILLDTVFGVYASWKLGKPILSSKLQRMIVKIGFYCGGFLLAYGVDYAILNDVVLTYLAIPLLFSKITAMIFILVEVFSIDEKIRLINNDVGLFKYIDRLIDRAVNIKRRLSKLFEKKNAV